MLVHGPGIDTPAAASRKPANSADRSRVDIEHDLPGGLAPVENAQRSGCLRQWQDRRHVGLELARCVEAEHALHRHVGLPRKLLAPARGADATQFRALEQQQVGPTFWQLTAIHVHLEGNALLFKSVSLQQDDKRTRFQPEPGNLELEQAAAAVMRAPELFACSDTLNPGLSAEVHAACKEKATAVPGGQP